jgi:hypothetical protein
MPRAKFNRNRKQFMIGDYIVVAFVLAIGLSFLGAIHYFWLRDAFSEETTPLDGRGESERNYEFSSVLNESSSNAGCQNSQFAIQASSRSQRNNRERFDPGSNTSRSSAARTKLCNTTSI